MWSCVHYLAARYRDDCSIEAPLVPPRIENSAPEAPIEPADALTHHDERFGDGRAHIVGLSLRDASGRTIGLASAGERVEVVISAVTNDRIGAPLVGFTLRNRLGDVVTATNTEQANASLAPLEAGEEVDVAFTFDWPSFTGGNFSISPAIADGTIYAHNMCDWVENPLIVQAHNPHGVFGWLSLDQVDARTSHRQTAGIVPEANVVPAESASILGAVERPSAPVIDRDDITPERHVFRVWMGIRE